MTESKQILTEVERKTLTTSEGWGLKDMGNISPGPPTVRGFSAGSNRSPKAAPPETEGLSTWTASCPHTGKGCGKSQRAHWCLSVCALREPASIFLFVFGLNAIFLTHIKKKIMNTLVRRITLFSFMRR